MTDRPTKATGGDGRRGTAPEGTMKDVSHTPTHGEGINHAFHRGGVAPTPHNDEPAGKRVPARDDEPEPR